MEKKYNKASITLGNDNQSRYHPEPKTGPKVRNYHVAIKRIFSE